MTDRRFEAPLAEQMATLKKTMHIRDKRRSSDRAERLVRLAMQRNRVFSQRFAAFDVSSSAERLRGQWRS